MRVYNGTIINSGGGVRLNGESNVVEDIRVTTAAGNHSNPSKTHRKPIKPIGNPSQTHRKPMGTHRKALSVYAPLTRPCRGPRAQWVAEYTEYYPLPCLLPPVHPHCARAGRLPGRSGGSVATLSC